MKKPQWKIQFKDLPLIPETKIWIKGNTMMNATVERQITEKLRLGYSITDSDEKTLTELESFYNELSIKLEELEYSSFTLKDLEDFKNYIKYVYNYIALLVNKIEIFQLYRIVIYSDNKTITNKKWLTYPPLHVVKKIGKLNRANTTNTTIFYGAETIDAALNELKKHIKVNDLVTVGKWVPNVKREFISYPISHSKISYGINPGSTKAVQGFLKYSKTQNPNYTKILEHYFQILGYEYSKEVSHHLEYLISATFSEDILDNPQNKNTNFDVECIVYPSVGNKFKTSNVAIRRDVFKHNFKLQKVIEFKVTETHFDRKESVDVEGINLVEYKNLRETEKFDENQIIW